jgi:hypothetical protein
MIDRATIKGSFSAFISLLVKGEFGDEMAVDSVKCSVRWLFTSFTWIWIWKRFIIEDYRGTMFLQSKVHLFI